MTPTALEGSKENTVLTNSEELRILSSYEPDSQPKKFCADSENARGFVDWQLSL